MNCTAHSGKPVVLVYFIRFYTCFLSLYLFTTVTTAVVKACYCPVSACYLTHGNVLDFCLLSQTASAEVPPRVFNSPYATISLDYTPVNRMSEYKVLLGFGLVLFVFNQDGFIYTSITHTFTDILNEISC